MSTAERDAETNAPKRRGLRVQVRRRQDSVIRARPRASRVHRVVLSLVFALVGAPILMSSAWVVESARFSTGEAAPLRRVRLGVAFGSGHHGTCRRLGRLGGVWPRGASAIPERRRQ